MMQADESAQSTQLTRSELLRVRFRHVIDPVASFLNRTGITPNTLTLIGLFGTIIGGLFLARGSFLVGGVIILLMGPLDALDGAMARLRGEQSNFGGLVDSVSDRYSEMSIFGGLLYYYLQRADGLWAGLVFLAACGSFMVSYVRARAEGLGYQVKGGLLTRGERFVVLVPSLILSYPEVGIALIALLANLTALHRIIIVRRQAHPH